MSLIIVKNIIKANKIIVSFDLSDGSFSFLTVELATEGDIDLNALVIKLIELIEKKRKFNVEFEDTTSLADSSPKIKLIKTTLEEIYSKFNNQIDTPENDTIQVEANTNDDLPF